MNKNYENRKWENETRQVDADGRGCCGLRGYNVNFGLPKNLEYRRDPAKACGHS
ncbi:hypothetical protein PUR_44080 [Paenibacillus sp. URB8-2]|nr:hypothetical protein PUR_44080 [Paenibacillus sp. URB8-2]